MASLGNAYRISLVVKVSDTRCEWADRSVWHDRHVGIVEVAGSNPAPSTRSVLGLSGDPEARASDYVFFADVPSSTIQHPLSLSRSASSISSGPYQT
jgi:hypothetical protein